MKDNIFYPEDHEQNENWDNRDELPPLWVAIMLAGLVLAFVAACLIAYANSLPEKWDPKNNWTTLEDPLPE